jgi:hypothetical protein
VHCVIDTVRDDQVNWKEQLKRVGVRQVLEFRPLLPHLRKKEHVYKTEK